MARLPNVTTTTTPIKTEAEIIIGERMRLREVLESPEGKRNPDAALKLAMRSTMSSSSIRDLLAGMPCASPYIAAMENEAIGITSTAVHGTSGAMPGSDPKETRKAELSAAAQSYASGKGYSASKGRG